MKKITLIKYLITSIILSLLIIKIKPEKLISIKNQISPLFLLISFLIIIIILLINSINLKIFLLPYLKKIKFIEFYKKYLITWSIGLFSPGKMGDFTLSYFIKENIKPGESLAALLIDKIITFTVLTSISLIGISYYFSKDLALKLVLSLIIILMLILNILKSEKITFILRKIPHIKQFTKTITRFNKTIKKYIKNHKKRILLNYTITCISWSLHSFGLFLLFKLLNQNPKYTIILFATGCSALSSLIPITINGMGIKEAVNIYLLEKFNIPKEITLFINLTMLTLSYMLSIIFIQLFFNQKTLKSKRKPEFHEHIVNKPTINN